MIPATPVHRRYASVMSKPLILLLSLHTLMFLGGIAAQVFQHGQAVGFSLHDDALISMRYAHNLARGDGLVWNKGEYIEGITNLGWTLWLACLHLINAGALFTPLLVQLTNLVINLFVIYVTYQYGLTCGGPAVAVIAGGLMTFSMPLLYWGLAGFETPLLTLLVGYSTLHFLARSYRGGAQSLNESLSPLVPLALSLAFVVRPDAVVAIAVLVSLTLIGITYDRSLSRIPLLATTLAVAIVLCTQAFRLSYFGTMVPNTAVLKIGSVPRSAALGYFWRQLPDTIIPMYGCCFVLAVSLLRRRNTMASAVVAGIPAAYLVYVCYTGGDVFGIGRFFLPSLPLAAVATSLLISPALGRTKPLIASLVLAIAFSLCLAKSYQVYLNLMRNKSASRDQFVLSLLLPTHVTEEESIAVAFAGGLPYYLPTYHFVDVHGKCDAFIARTKPHANVPIGHNKWDMRYVIRDRNVKAIVSGGYAPWHTNADFNRLFSPHFVRVPGSSEVKGFWVRQ
jgi:hypothetical protein